MAIYAFSCGFEIFIVLRRQPSSAPLKPWSPGGEWSHDFHFGVEFDDGRRTSMGMGPDPHLKTWLDAFRADQADPEPVGPTIMSLGGGGGATGSHHWNNWIWPLPPGAGLRLGWEWKGQGIDFETKSIEAEPIRQAAANSAALWALEAPPTAE